MSDGLIACVASVVVCECDTVAAAGTVECDDGWPHNIMPSTIFEGTVPCHCKMYPRVLDCGAHEVGDCHVMRSRNGACAGPSTRHDTEPLESV